MKNLLVILVMAAFLFEWSKSTSVAEAAESHTLGQIVTGYSSKGDMVILLNGNTSILSLPTPNDEDRKYVAHVPEAIRKAVIAFISQPKTDFSIEAARAYGRILLLDVAPKGVDDGNIQVVYDLKRGIVVGRFTWYIQG